MKRNGFAEVVPAIRFIVQAIDKTFGGCGLLKVEFIRIKDKETASPRWFLQYGSLCKRLIRPSADVDC